jgi:SAM-dependent methyltransferase
MQYLPSPQDSEGSVAAGFAPYVPESAACYVAPVFHMTEAMTEFDRLYKFDEETGALRQKDLTVECVYDEEYVRSRYDSYSTTPDISYLRANLTEVFCPIEDGRVLDFGCGNGSYLYEMEMRGWECYGMDISGYPFDETDVVEIAPNPGIEVDVVTFFDSLEHLPRPQAVLANLNCRYVVISLPWLSSEGMGPHEFMKSFMKWKHRRYGEHLWHFTPASLAKMMENAGFGYVYHGNFEDRIRKGDGVHPNILTAIFKKLE